MKLVCPRAELTKAVSLAASAVSTKSSLPVLNNLLFEVDKNGLVVTGTDLEIGLRCRVKVEVIEPGAITIPAKKMTEILRELEEGEVELSSDGNKAELKADKNTFRLPGIAAEDYPNFPSYRKEKSVTLPVATLLAMIRKTSFSVSVDETRYVLQGALLQVAGKKARMVSTDGHRLSFVEKEAEKSSEDMQAVVPSKALAELAKVLEGSDGSVTVYFTDNQLFVELGEVTLFSRLIDGQFPNYEQVIPKKNELSFTAETEALAKAAKRVAVMAQDKGNSIKLSLKENSLEISAATPDLGEAQGELDVAYKGGAITMAFNARYLLDVLKSLESERVEVRMSTPLSPCLVGPEGGDGSSKYVIMPMRT